VPAYQGPSDSAEVNVMPAKMGHLSKKNLKQYLASEKGAALKTAAPKKAGETANRSKKKLAARAKVKTGVLKRRRVRTRIAAGK